MEDIESKFKKGENVINKTTNKIGTVNNVIFGSREIQYRVTFEGKQVTIPERDLGKFIDIEERIIEDVSNRNFGTYEDYRLFHTWLRLALPLENNLYSYLGSKTTFNPYQFKPLLKFLSLGSDERLFIADEVGVGKTIETGIIINELISRNRLDSSTPIIVICPNSITQKWKREMKERFNLDFFVHDGKSLMEMLREIRTEGSPKELYRFSIVGLQLFRTDKPRELLKNILDERVDPTFGMTVIDEAHHLRNVGTNSYDLGMKLSQTSEMMLMLSATPLNLDDSDLYNQLHILNPIVFEDQTIFQNLQKPVKKINQIIRLIYEFPASKDKIEVALGEMEKDEIGQALLKREWLTDFKVRLNKEVKFNTQEAVKFERLFSNLNPLYSSFTRTRKREAIEHQIKREAKELPIQLTKDELTFQTEFLDTLNDYFSERGYDESILSLIMNTHRRMISSSIPAISEYLESSIRRGTIEREPSKEEEDLIEDDFSPNTTEIGPELMKKFKYLLQKAKDLERIDSKYNQFRRLLSDLFNGNGDKQVIVFSFFIKTLEYLKERLLEDGYTVGMIHGGIPMTSKDGKEGREEIIQKFKNGGFKILLSSEVGGEGLDFQFCNTIFNYDLPYNPMRIEQRIGRVDRFGQKSDKILVVNLFIKGTVDEQIYERLYKRIRLVEDGVGALEPIMGSQLSEFQQELLSEKLTEAEVEERQERIKNAVEHKKKEMQSFENHRKELLNDDFLSSPINEFGKGGFVEPKDAMQLSKLFLENYENCSLSPRDEHVSVMTLSKEVKGEIETFLRTKEGKRGNVELTPIWKSPSSIQVVFNGSVAENYSNCVFLPPTGYWSKFITEKLKERDSLKRVFQFSPNINELKNHSRGVLVSIYQVKFEGLRNQIQLIGIPIDLDDVEKSVNIDCEELPRLLSDCEINEDNVKFYIPPLQNLLVKTGDVLTEFLEKSRESMSEENSSLLNARITALENSSKQRKMKKELDIENHKKKRMAEGKIPDENYIKLTNAKIEKDQKLTDEKIRELRKLQNLSYSYSLEAVVFLM
jgi:SNF2 family DNA or RNA helicase